VSAKPDKVSGKPEKLSRKDYESELQKLQIELSYLQDWVRETGARVSSSAKAATPPARAG
jgi:polyphosphate kinase 2 (PPK2 family)